MTVSLIFTTTKLSNCLVFYPAADRVEQTRLSLKDISCGYFYSLVTICGYYTVGRMEQRMFFAIKLHVKAAFLSFFFIYKYFPTVLFLNVLLIKFSIVTIIT